MAAVNNVSFGEYKKSKAIADDQSSMAFKKLPPNMRNKTLPCRAAWLFYYPSGSCL